MGSSKEQGLIIHFDEERRNDLVKDYGEQNFSFSDALSVADWELKQIQVVNRPGIVGGSIS